MNNNLPTSTLSVNAKINNNNNKSKKIKMKKNALDPVDFEEEKRKDPKYKTELCKSWIETHFCAYGNKCRFAHGKEELVIKNQNSNYKKKSCKSFIKYGFCPYGSRCNFKHDSKKLKDIQLPYFFINLFIKNQFNCEKRLKVFEDITNEYINNNIYSDTTFSDNSSNCDSPYKNNIFYYNNNNYNNNNNNNYFYQNINNKNNSFINQNNVFYTNNFNYIPNITNMVNCI